MTIVWADAPEVGRIEVEHGQLAGIECSDPDAVVNAAQISRGRMGPAWWLVTIADACNRSGRDATRVRVVAGDRSFTFFARDSAMGLVIVVAAYGVAVAPGRDSRPYTCLRDSLGQADGDPDLRGLQHQPEASYERCSPIVRDSHAPTWLGLSRDMRMFEIDWLVDRGYWGVVRPKVPIQGIGLSETNGQPVEYGFVVGRGTNCTVDVTRRLEDGCLPIVLSRAQDAGIDYHLTAFADLEWTPLSAETLRGTHYLVADRHAFGCSQTPKQQQRAVELEPEEYDALGEQTLLCIQVTARNNTKAPAYAWFQAPNPEHVHTSQAVTRDDYADYPGQGRFSRDRVYCVARLDGAPLRQVEVAVLVPPGGEATMEFYIPHQPIVEARAQRLLDDESLSFAQRHERCRTFWREKLGKTASVQLPEQRLEEMLKAGVLHLDLITYGHEAVGPLAPCVGRYAPIGTESSPIIQYYDTIGRHDLARRCLQYFFDKQRPSGQMQNYQNYQSETGPVLWTAGEHYRYTRDENWVRRIAKHVHRACDFLIAWRHRNMTEAHRGRGYGMIDGSVADPEVSHHYFMNAGYTCLGLARAAEMLRTMDPRRSDELAGEADQMRQDILVALREAVARGPVVPLEDGTWMPTVGPFVQSEGAMSLLADRNIALTHSSFTIHDAAIGPLHLIFQEVLAADTPLAEILLRTHHRLNTVRNVTASQPYYCRHDYAHLRRGEVSAFLECYYNAMAAQADRETYTFWEHQYRTGVHKTHEEAWFLMQTRWMLMLEVDQTLRLLQGIPRRWLAEGKTLSFTGLVSYFGPVSLSVDSRLDQGVITAHVQGAKRPLPATVVIRLPHPDGLRATACSMGEYDAATETVRINGYRGDATVELRFNASC
ncbi:hypothetical protein ACERK3_07065 [Phycisphaerales bacterium AB-hyl4]|uniref:Uncharacterized protein n=1 Tax=Natronomicrosphaera hydrolytica TaxID=3242702 RepID=A0ABV4U382_9BACT